MLVTRWVAAGLPARLRILPTLRAHPCLRVTLRFTRSSFSPSSYYPLLDWLLYVGCVGFTPPGLPALPLLLDYLVLYPHWMYIPSACRIAAVPIQLGLVIWLRHPLRHTPPPVVPLPCYTFTPYFGLYLAGQLCLPAYACRLPMPHCLHSRSLYPFWILHRLHTACHGSSLAHGFRLPLPIPYAVCRTLPSFIIPAFQVVCMGAFCTPFAPFATTLHTVGCTDCRSATGCRHRLPYRLVCLPTCTRTRFCARLPHLTFITARFTLPSPGCRAVLAVPLWLRCAH